MKKCEKCLNRVPVMSENGLHYNCGLNENHAIECRCEIKDRSLIFDPKIDEEDSDGTDRQTT